MLVAAALAAAMSAHAPRFIELLELARASHPELAIDDATFAARCRAGVDIVFAASAGDSTPR